MAELVEKVLNPVRPIVGGNLLELLDTFHGADLDLRISRNWRRLVEKLRVEWPLRKRLDVVDHGGDGKLELFPCTLLILTS